MRPPTPPMIHTAPLFERKKKSTAPLSSLVFKRSVAHVALAALVGGLVLLLLQQYLTGEGWALAWGAVLK